jgi:RimJ/RimL family protein N-acetyltransferase
MIETERLILREWKPDDLAAMSAINQDSLVMQAYPSTLTEEETAAWIAAQIEHFNNYGFGIFACECKDTRELIGFIGFAVTDSIIENQSCIEIVWRLARASWGHGYAAEGARAIIEKAFTHWNVQEIVGFALKANIQSQRVMEKLGMIAGHTGNHPANYAADEHALYHLTYDAWNKQQRR